MAYLNGELPVSPYLKKAAIVGSTKQLEGTRDLPQELARRSDTTEQEEADIM